MHTTYSPKLSLPTLLLFISLLTTSYAAGTLQITPGQLQINSSPVTYSFTLGATGFTNIPSGSSIYIDFPTDYSTILPTTPSCQDDSGNTLACTISSRRITITNYFNSAIFDNTFKFKILALKNPAHTGATGTFTASIVSGSTTLVDGTKTITISEATATCSINTVSKVIGATTTVTFSIVTSTAIPANGGLEITFPWWSQSGDSMIVTPLTCSITTPSASTPGSCNAQTISNGNQLLALLMPNAVAAGATLTFQLQSIRNPPVATAYSVGIRTLDTSNLGLDACSVNLQATTPNAITVNTGSFLTCITNSNVKKINTQETCILSFTTTNPLPSGSTINVRFPTEVGLSSSYRVNEDRPYSISTLSISSSPSFPDVLLTNPITSYTVGSTAVDLRFISLIHPSTTKPTSSFQITTYYGGNAIDTITSGVTYTASAGDLSTVTVTASPSQAGSLSDVTFSFSVGNSVTSSSQIVIVFPSEFTTDAGTVTCTGSGTKMNSSPTCNMVSKTLTISSYATASITSSDTVNIIVRNIGLPKTTKPTTTPFEVSTVESSFTVDKSSSTYFTATVASITSGLSLTVSNGAEVGGISAYTVTFQNKNPIPADGQFQVGLPSDGTITISDSLAVQTGTTILVGSTTLTPVSTVGTSTIKTVTFTNPFSTVIAAGTTIKITIPSLNNPPSTAITTSFSVKTMTSDGYAIDSTTTGLNLLANVVSASDFQSVNISPSPATTGSTSVYTFTIIPKVAHTSSHTLTITFPSSITFQSTVTCTVAQPVSQSAVSCVPNGSKVISISIGQAVAALATFQMTVSGIINPIGANTYSGFSLATMISTAKVHQTVNAISIAITPSIITDATLSRSNKVPSSAAVYTFNYTPKNQYPTTAFIEVIVPSQLSVSTASTLKCTDLLGFGATPTCQLKASTTNTIWITGGGAYSNSRIRFALDSIVNQATQTDSDSFIINIKETGTEAIIDQVTSGLASLSPCDSTCATCLDTSRTSCTSCASNKLHDLVNLKCVDSCVTGTYKDGTDCKACNTKCLACTGSTDTQCSSCVTTSTYSEYFSGQCLSQCPSKFYSDASHNCQSCVSPCETCTNLNTCKTCDSSNFYYEGACNTFCPSGYYKDTNSRSCLKCNSNCKTCSSSSGCDTCDTSVTSTYPIFYNNNCINKCPDGFFSSSNTCSQCTTPCRTCSLTATNCLTCTDGLFANNGACISCASTCQTCSGTFDSCTSCKNSLLLQGTKCLSTCSEGYYIDTALQMCQKCSSTCQTCSSLTTCTSCSAGSSTPYMFDGACLSACPAQASVVVGRQCTATTTTERVNQYDGLYRNGLPVPFLIVSLVFCVLSFVGRIIVPQTLVVSNMLGFLAPLEFGAWIALAVLLFLSHIGDNIGDYTGFPFVLIGILASLIVNIIFYFKVIRPLVKSESVTTWKNRRRVNRAFLIIGQIFALITFKSFRLTFSRFFGLEHMSLPLPDAEAFFLTFHKYLGINFFLSVLPAFIAAVITIHKDAVFSQLLNISIEIILISLFTISLSIYEALRPNELLKKAEIAPDQTNLIGSVLEDSVMNKLNGEEGALRRSGDEKVHAAKGSRIIDEENEGDGSFINLENTMMEKREDDSVAAVEGGGHGNENENENENDENENKDNEENNDKSQIEAIEEIEKDDEDEEPTLNMNSKTMGRLQEILKGRGHELSPEKLLIENADGSIIVLHDPAGKKGKKKGKKDGENPGSGNEEDSEQELELHDSFEDAGPKMENAANHQPNNADQEANTVRNSKELKVSTEGLLSKEEGKGEDFEVVSGGLTKSPKTGDVVEVESPESPEFKMKELRKSALGGEGKQDEEGSPEKKDQEGLEYVSSGSDVTADDMHDHNNFMDDTPSNYNALNQRYDEEFVSPAVVIGKKTGTEVTDTLKRSVNGSPQKPVVMQSNFVDKVQPQSDYRSTGRELPPRPTLNNDQQASKSSYGKPMMGEKSKIMEAGMKVVTPQSGQGKRMIPENGRRQSNQSTGYRGSGSVERKVNESGSVKDSKNGRTSEKASTDRINELENLYMKKKEVPSLKSSLSKISKKQVNPQKSLDDDMDIDELELNNFEKFEDFVNGMKKQGSIQKLEADSFDRENI